MAGVSAAWSPAALTPAVWFDGAQSAYSDTGSTVPAPAPTGRVRRMDQPASVGGQWSAASDAARPYKDGGAIWVDGQGMAVTSPTVSVPQNDHTVWWRGRLSHVYGNIGGLMDNGTVGLFPNSTGDFRRGTLLTVRPAGFAATGLEFNALQDCTIVYTVSSSGIVITVRQGGTSTSFTDAVAIGSGTLTSWRLGPCFIGNPGLGRVYTGGVVGRQITAGEKTSLIDYLDTLTGTFPLDCPLVVVAGDSIAFGVFAGTAGSWACKTSRALTTAGTTHRMEQAAYPGWILSQMTTDYSATVAPLYSASRSRNVLIAAGATNDIAFGSLTAAQVLSAYWAYCDAARAAGWRVVACTVLPRSDALIRGTFEADRTTFNAAIIADWASHADALADVSAVAGMGAAGDSNNATNYSDLVHPTAAGYTLLEPTYTAATQVALA